jgi:hypothetical protein
MPKRTHDFIDWRDDWRNCRAKKQLIQDLESGFIPLLPSEMSANEAQQLRDLYLEVEGKKFKRNLESLRKSVRESKGRALMDSAGLSRDRLHRSTHPVSARDGTRWHGSEAQLLLRQDMQQGRHFNRKELWESRPEYNKHFSLRSFRDHISAEERRQKRVAKRQAHDL